MGWGVEDINATEEAKPWKDFGEEDIKGGGRGKRSEAS